MLRSNGPPLPLYSCNYNTIIAIILRLNTAHFSHQPSSVCSLLPSVFMPGNPFFRSNATLYYKWLKKANQMGMIWCGTCCCSAGAEHIQCCRGFESLFFFFKSTTHTQHHIWKRGITNVSHQLPSHSVGDDIVVASPHRSGLKQCHPTARLEPVCVCVCFSMAVLANVSRPPSACYVA